MATGDAKRIDTLYRNVKGMPLATLLGTFIPIALLIAAPLGLVYASQRKQLLADIDAGRIEVDDETEAKVAALRQSSIVCYVPACVLAAAIVLIVIAVNSR